ncbi:MAG: signal peptidase II [Gaiellales bacterium]
MSALPPTSPVDPTKPQRQPADALYWTALVVIILVTVAADQVTKKIARDSFTPNDPFEVLPFFHFTNTWNTGIAFGQFRDNQVIVIALSIIAIAWMLVYFARSGGRSPILPVAIGLLAGGASSNLFDRLTQGHVTDFLELSHFPVFNLADAAITVGVILLLITLLSGERRQPR